MQYRTTALFVLATLAGAACASGYTTPSDDDDDGGLTVGAGGDGSGGQSTSAGLGGLGGMGGATGVTSVSSSAMSTSASTSVSTSASSSSGGPMNCTSSPNCPDCYCAQYSMGCNDYIQAIIDNIYCGQGCGATCAALCADPMNNQPSPACDTCAQGNMNQADINGFGNDCSLSNDCTTFANAVGTCQ